MRASYTNSRQGNAHHNDRDFDLSKAPHIDQERSHLNKYHNMYNNDNLSFYESELQFYKENFSGLIDKTNAMYRKYGHPERCLTPEKLLRSVRTRPEETIYQIGNFENHPTDPSDLEEIYNELERYSRKITRRRCLLLNRALHMDEAVPHIHVRRVWVYKDDDGILKIGQEKALEAAGIPLPHPDKPVDRYNNRKITYDRMMREKMEQLCEERGYELDMREESRKHLTISEYKRRKEYERRMEEEQREQEEERRKEERSAGKNNDR